MHRVYDGYERADFRKQKQAIGKDGQACEQKNESKQAGELNLWAAGAPIEDKKFAFRHAPTLAQVTCLANWYWIRR